MAYNITGTAGNDALSQSGDSGPGTIVGLAGNDVIFTGTGQAVAYGNSGNDIICLQPGNTGSVWGGGENDFIFGPPGPMVLFGNEGGDTVEVSSVSANETVVGGNDSADGADSIVTGA